MSLRAKVIILLGLTVALMVGLSTTLFTHIVLSAFVRTEASQTHALMQRLRHIIENKFTYLQSKASDWAMWDDSYRFIHDRNPDFVRTNLNADAVANLGIRAILLIDGAGEIAAAAEIDPATGDLVDPSPGLLAHLRPGSPILNLPNSDSSAQGLIEADGRRLMIVARPIVPSDGQGPARGAMVFVADAAGAAAHSWSDLAGASVTLHEPDDPAPDVADAVRALSAGRRSVSAPLTDGMVAGYMMLRDVYGHPAVIVRARTPRTAYYNGLVSERYLIGSIVAIGLLLGIAILLAVEHLVLRRVRRLGWQLHAIRTGAGPGRRVRTGGRDELSALAGAINRVLDALDERARLQEHQSAELASKASELDHARRAADAANQAKSDFLAHMSHEIRTPMTAILGFADLLAEGDSPAGAEGDRADHVRIIQRSGRHLLNIINDILDLSRIESGQMPVELLRCSPARIVAEVASLMRSRAAAKGLSLSVVCPEPIPETIHTDPTRLRQVLMNLVSNAVKFTDRGGITIALAMRDEEAPSISATITDTGIGISADHLSRVFQPFVQADSSMSRRYGGTGLGLSISRRLARMLGGDLHLSSVPGEGTTATLTIETGSLDGIPFVAFDTDGVAREPEPAPAHDQTITGTVLLAEDGPDNRRLISFHLGRAGARVTTAENGREAVDAAMEAMARGRPFDIIIMDMQMPVLDGYSAAKELRSRGYGGPIIALTAHAMTGDRERCLAAGCTDYATKPIDRARLLAACTGRLAA